jgi:hypothetical protein
MRFALNDITMSENKMVVAVENASERSPAKTCSAEDVVSPKVTKRAVDKKLTAEDIARA